MESSIAREATLARRWRYVWTGINGMSTAAPLVAVPLVGPDVRPDLIAGSVVSAISTGFTFFWPLEVEGASLKMSAVSGLAPCDRLEALQGIVASAAQDEIARRAWPWHLVNFGVSAALGAVLAFGFDHPIGGLFTGLSGFAVGEAQLFTQPANLSAEAFLPTALSGLRPLWSTLPSGQVAIVGGVLQWSLP